MASTKLIIMIIVKKLCISKLGFKWDQEDLAAGYSQNGRQKAKEHSKTSVLNKLQLP